MARRPNGDLAQPRELLEVGSPAARAESFRRLAATRLDASYRLARAILGEPAEAEDAVHDAFVSAWLHWSDLRDPARFEAWFDRIVVNTCRNRLRSRSRARVADISAELAVRAPGDPFGGIHDRDEVREALDTLDADHLIVVTLRFYADLTVDQIAARTGLRSGTVKSRLHYAMGRLQAALGESENQEAAR